MRGEKVTLVVSQQILREYIAVAARIRDVAGGLSTTEIIENVAAFRAECIVFDDTPAVFERLISLLGTVAGTDRRVYDTNIVATMLAHGVRRLLTHNVGDFARFGDLVEVVPLDAA